MLSNNHHQLSFEQGKQNVGSGLKFLAGGFVLGICNLGGWLRCLVKCFGFQLQPALCNTHSYNILSLIGSLNARYCLFCALHAMSCWKTAFSCLRNFHPTRNSRLNFTTV